MPTTDLHYLGLIEVGQQIQARKLSPVEVTKAMLGRIEVATTMDLSPALSEAERAW